ncbi:MAG: helix-turn-helix transcriptional regulator [Candidatus Accumulibacter sp.]|jgi:DNA-binding NarL/FixJ family response regulator|nr:helix-turn-helix transcriptional regulator [Accumulibacter sp.]
MRALAMELLSLLMANARPGAGLRARLRLCLFAFMAAVFAIAAVLLSLLGVFSPRQDVGARIGQQLDGYERRLEAYFDRIAAQGIYLSQRLGVIVEKTLAEKNASFDEVSDNGALIAAIERNAYPLLYEVLRAAEGSGSFFMLDATVNTKIPNAADSKAGIYLKLANINAARPVNPDVWWTRGVHDVGHANGLIFHNKWQLEFDVSRIPFYGAFLKSATGNPAESYYYAPARHLHGTWEKIMLLCVPIVGKDGRVYGLAGLEINSLIFKLLHARQNARFARIAGLVAQKRGNVILPETGLDSGAESGYYADLDKGALTVKPMADLNEYVYTVPGGAGAQRFVGLDRKIALSPLSAKLDAGSPWVVACMVPAEDYERMIRAVYLKAAAFFLTLLAGSFLLCHLLSLRYARSVARRLREIKEGAAQKTDIAEIDDLLEFIAARSAAREAEANMSDFNRFRENVKTLTKAETAVFEHYLQGDNAAGIAAKLSVSINTVKTHNKAIFRKLNVSSLKELRIYARVLRDKGADFGFPPGAPGATPGDIPPGEKT